MMMNIVVYITRNSPEDEIPQRNILLRLLRLTSPMEGLPWDDLRKILHGGQRIANGVKSIAASFNPEYRRQRDRQTTDVFAIAKAQT